MMYNLNYLDMSRFQKVQSHPLLLTTKGKRTLLMCLYNHVSFNTIETDPLIYRLFYGSLSKIVVS